MKIIISVVLILSANFCFAQNPVSLEELQNIELRIQKLYRSDSNDEAMAVVDSALQEYPNHHAYLNLKALLVLNLGPINDEKNDRIALELLNKAIEQKPSYASYYNNRGWVHQFLDDYEAAKKDYDLAAELNPTSVNLMGNTLRILWMMKRNKEALAKANEIIETFPKDGYAYHVRGNLKRDYLHKYIEGNKDIKISKELGWNGGIFLVY